MILYALGAWIMLVLLVILCFSLRMNERIETIIHDLTYVKSTLKLYLTDIARNRGIK